MHLARVAYLTHLCPPPVCVQAAPLVDKWVVTRKLAHPSDNEQLAWCLGFDVETNRYIVHFPHYYLGYAALRPANLRASRLTRSGEPWRVRRPKSKRERPATARRMPRAAKVH